MVEATDVELTARIRVMALHELSKDAWMRDSDDGYRHCEVEHGVSAVRKIATAHRPGRRSP